MNIFLPYENDISMSVKSLDDLRLNKQILECKTMYEAIANKYTTGYINHPVTQFYKNNPLFIALYGNECCIEYKMRTNKWHPFTLFFSTILMKNGIYSWNIKKYKFTPFYAEGSKNSPNCIRTTENVSQLFRNKLCKKWDNDKANGRSPKWTRRQQPEWYKVE